MIEADASGRLCGMECFDIIDLQLQAEAGRFRLVGNLAKKDREVGVVLQRTEARGAKNEWGGFCCQAPPRAPP
jgi:hypothetical protein